ncbi:MAG: primosomal protein N' [Actinomycetaceae bacterium]|nr:primosomal protein N' [Actinomycetaceae bacterium]
MMQHALPGLEEPPATQVEIAHVLVDTDIPHLDHIFDYSIPAKLLDRAQIGHLVQIRLAGKKYSGWIIDRSRGAPMQPLQPLLSVVSRAPVLDTELLEVARTIADRYVATVPQALSLAIPPRHASTEKDVLGSFGGDGPSFPPLTRGAPTPQDTTSSWNTHPVGRALSERIAQGQTVRAVWTALKSTRDSQLVDLVASTVKAGRGAIIILPTHREVGAIANLIEGHLGIEVARQGHGDNPALRYRIHLEGLLGRTQIIVGTRSAVWTPMADLGLIIIWDDADDVLRERRHPRTDALEVAMVRSRHQNSSLIVGSWSRSIRAQALCHSGWAEEIVADLATRRAHTPIVRVLDEVDSDWEGPGGAMRINSAGLRLIKEGLKNGPVLVHVPYAGYIPVVACARCYQRARCLQCTGPIGLDEAGQMTCQWCGRDQNAWRCPHCHGTVLRARRIGSVRTGEELGRAFPGIPLTVVLKGDPPQDLSSRPRLVIATPGCEPEIEGGYAACLILDASAIAGRSELWAPEEALRRWFAALSLVRPTGSALVSGGVDPVLTSALTRWDPADYAQRALDERHALGYFPAATLIAFDGQPHDIAQILSSLGPQAREWELGTVRLTSSSLHLGGDNTLDFSAQHTLVRTIMRIPRSQTTDVLAQLKAIIQVRSSNKSPRVQIHINPPELF